MNAALLCAVVLVCACSSRAINAAETADDQPCPVAGATASPQQYRRMHQIPTTDHDDLPMVTPGGMILPVPKMVAATDVLTITGRDETALCFRLVTFGRDRQQCRLSGVARAESESVYVFRDEDAVVRFTALNADQIRVEPMGDAYRRNCESLGVIEPASYSRAAARGRRPIAREETK